MKCFHQQDAVSSGYFVTCDECVHLGSIQHCRLQLGFDIHRDIYNTVTMYLCTYLMSGDVFEFIDELIMIESAGPALTIVRRLTSEKRLQIRMCTHQSIPTTTSLYTSE